MRILILAGLLLISGFAVSDARSAEWHDAIQSNQVDTIRKLYRQQADIDQGTEHGKTALMAAAAAGDGELVRELLAAGADPAATNHLGGSVLLYAVGSGDPESVRELLATGIALDGQASNGWSAIMMAAAKNDPTMLELLAGAGADPNTPDIYGWTPLMRAAYERHEATVAALFALDGLDLDHTNNNGQNVLHLAVIAGDVALVQELLGRGAIQIKDLNGYTPQSIARELERDDLLALLEAARPED